MVRRWRMQSARFLIASKFGFPIRQTCKAEINRTTVTKLRNRDYTFVDLLEGEHHLVVSVFPHTGAFHSGLQLKQSKRNSC